MYSSEPMRAWTDQELAGPTAVNQYQTARRKELKHGEEKQNQAVG
jgi:hypothetical protein